MISPLIEPPPPYQDRPLVIAVSGSRYDRLGEEVRLTEHQISSFIHLLKSLSQGRSIILKHGAAPGVDRHVDEICREPKIHSHPQLHITIMPFPVVQSDGRWPMAGKIRNIRMIRTSQPETERLIVFNLNPRRSGGGTLHAIEVGHKMSIPIWSWSGLPNHGHFVRA